jgi:ABC-type sugar transport system permease subunit
MTPEVISPEPVHATGRKVSRVLRILALIAGISVVVGLFRIGVILYVALAVAVVGLVWKFIRDNRGLFGAAPGRTMIGMLQGVFWFIPILLAMLPGVAAAWGVDVLSDELIGWLRYVAADPLPVDHSFPLFDPSKWIDWYVQSRTPAPVANSRPWLKVIIDPLDWFLTISSVIAWLIVGFAALRAYFHFVARILTLKGERITMELPHYRQ